MLYRRSAKTNPWGSPFFKRHNMQGLMSTVIGKDEAFVLNKFHNHKNYVVAGRSLSNLQVMPQCHTTLEWVKICFG